MSGTGKIPPKITIPTSKAQLASALARKATNVAASKTSEKIQSAAQPKPAAGQSDEDKSGLEKGIDGAKQTVGNAAAGAASGAVQGAVVGGAAGAVAGAVKGGVVSLAQDRNVQKVVLGALALVLAVIVVIVMMVGSAAGAIGGAVGEMDDQNAQHTVDREIAAGDGLEQAAVSEARLLAGKHHVPWPLVLAVLEEDEEADIGALAGALMDADPTYASRDLTAGYTFSSSQVAMIAPVGTAGGGEDPEHPAARAAAEVEEMYVTALTNDKVGFNERTAQHVFERARAWATADPDGANACTAHPNVNDGDLTGIGDEDWTEGQIMNMKTIIGIAKTMFEDDARDAAIIGLITARVESRFLTYANDGVVGAEDFNMGSATAADYAKLAYSLELPHDAVGTDHASLGIMQQQATAGWGDYGSSTWQSDHKTVIERLMDPRFVTAKFFVRLDGIDWRSMEPGVAAQTVQVSAHPERYAEHVQLAEAIWDEYGEQAPIEVPKESGWSGAVSSGDGTRSGSACGSGRVLDGDMTWPVDIDDEGMFAGVISSDWGQRIHPSGRPQFHEGIDWTGNGEGSGIYAIAAGEVTRSSIWPNPACGEYVEILHADGTSTGYLHQNTRAVSVGDKIEAGTFLGEMGGNQPGGCSFGAHLHLYTYDESGCTMDPKVWFEERGLPIPDDKFLSPSPRGQTPGNCI